MEASVEAIRQRLRAAEQGASALCQAALDARTTIRSMLQELEAGAGGPALRRLDEEAPEAIDFGGVRVALVATWEDGAGWVRAAPLQ